MSSALSRIKFKTRGGRPWVELLGEIDLGVGTVADADYAACETPGTVTVDMSAATFMDSAGIVVLLRLRDGAGDGVRIVNAPAQIAKLLAVTGLTEMFRRTTQ